MWFSAFVRNKQTNEKRLIEDIDYITKKDFANDLRSNGYTVIRISNKRDLKAQEMNFSSVDVLKKMINWEKRNGFNTERYEEMLKEIEEIKL